MINAFHALSTARLRRLWNLTWVIRHQGYCRIFHWHYRKPAFGGYGFGGRTDQQTGIHCSKCHTTRAVSDWQKAVVVKSDAQITAEIDEYGSEQLTPEGYWRGRRWVPKRLT